MKSVKFFSAFAAFSLLLACTMPVNNTKKGIVDFYNNPKYDTSLNEIIFRAIFSYATYTTGKAVEIEYQILDGSEIIASGSALADIYCDIGLDWSTDEITVSIDQETYGGRTITIFLDPEAKLISDTYLNPALDGRKETVTIPVP
ncbi:MAG: hypothetical protein ACLFST_09950 [Spirochaetia bacterium]